MTRETVIFIRNIIFSLLLLIAFIFNQTHIPSSAELFNQTLVIVILLSLLWE